MADLSERVRTSLAGHYAIERELGRGGMATVYLAEDVKHHRKVAVKVLRPELAATLGEDRFFREIEVAAQLQHPHILPLLDSGEADGFFYYVMPYVEGESLRERLAQHGELPVHDAVRILSEVVDALAHAHQHGVVHRDIKPDNILLSGRHALVMRCLAKRAADRWQTADELLAQLEPLTTPSGGITPTGTHPIVAPRSRRRWGVAAAGVAALTLLVVFLVGHRRHSDQGTSDAPALSVPSVAVLPFSDLSPQPGQEHFADGLTDEVIVALSKVPGLRVPGRASAFYFQ